MITIVETTCSSREQAEELAKAAVTNKLSACCHIMPIDSCYEWKGEAVQEKETLLRMKTTEEVLPKLLLFLEKNHPYDIPEIIAYKVEHASQKYLSWVTSFCKVVGVSCDR